MVDQRLCPKCGSVMDLGEIYLKGKAACAKCGFQGLPVAEFKIPINVKKEVEEYPEDNHDQLGMDNLLGKISIVCAGMIAISISQGAMALALVSLVGMVLFGVSHYIKKRKIRGK